MHYILSEEELFEERETLRAQLNEQTIISAANMLLKAALWKAVGETLCGPDYLTFCRRVDALRRDGQKQFPADSPIHAYFEEPKDPPA